ncbi:hypothetical protein N5P37_000658 [Trichoderma harzianum]|uniref:Uncharacterized protein n=1 Tax=Trichoderma harzianum CBS 226.95 TaxID=983964 RepID=A0A2T4AID6_TRIHA|nr:hypothetical protein M431DRAFT_506590 [Trichoderma harzianum CBS 226.95]KAK0766928.1 hypothetical protein N5P37_000658 [Trichoderma harzianum]PKK54350.1 hypothetical protein CI102_725 [Trichoderma harzianum]PTB56845.1 hypothetical protein M431DRAFT_506590 [Trichoderma harzianum CBS 226.95]
MNPLPGTIHGTQHDWNQAAMAQFAIMMEQLQRLENRMTAAEERAEERMQLFRQQMNASLQQINMALDRTARAEQQQRRTTALVINQQRRAQNTSTWLCCRKLFITHLVPLCSQTTGADIERFPRTYGDIGLLDENDARRILTDLEISAHDCTLAEMQDLIRFYVVYP